MLAAAHFSQNTHMHRPHVFYFLHTLRFMGLWTVVAFLTANGSDTKLLVKSELCIFLTQWYTEKIVH